MYQAAKSDGTKPITGMLYGEGGCSPSKGRGAACRAPPLADTAHDLITPAFLGALPPHPSPPPPTVQKDCDAQCTSCRLCVVALANRDINKCGPCAGAG